MKSLLAMLLLGPALALADCPDVDVTGAWVREPPPGATGTAGYLEIRNSGAKAVLLRDWRSESFEMTMLHETLQTAYRSSMRHREVLEVPAQGTSVLAPGGLHLMLMGPRTPLRAGETVSFVVACGDSTLEFSATVKTDAAGQP